MIEFGDFAVLAQLNMMGFDPSAKGLAKENAEADPDYVQKHSKEPSRACGEGKGRRTYFAKNDLSAKGLATATTGAAADYVQQKKREPSNPKDAKARAKEKEKTEAETNDKYFG